ncbi:MAG: polysaccharide deacetylase family protein, partial [Bacilli bacterium]|nr:polysaccharide deacetylase family protein [Bacilli bacterium]
RCVYESDIAPELTINQEYAIQYKCKNKNKFNLDYVAEDNYDGIITDKVNVKVDKDKVILSIIDSSNNETKREVPLKIIDDGGVDVIELVGKDIVYLPIGSAYEDEGATLKDGCGNEVNTSNGENITFEVVNEVDTNKAGEYAITYQYTNEVGEIIKKARKVVVYDKKDSAYYEEKGEKVVYLTFDDGPGQYTEELLDILKRHNVKATFFVTNQFKKYIPLIKREHDEGHVVAVHSLTHKWSIYQSVETYLKDFNDMNDIIYKYTGERAQIFRFPGGGSNTISRKYAKGVVKAIASKMTENGYVYFDWNVDSNDAAGAKSDAIYKNVIDGIEKHKSSVVLMHDIKRGTVDVIEDIIKYGLENGYTFKTLTVSSPTVHHHINN